MSVIDTISEMPMAIATVDRNGAILAGNRLNWRALLVAEQTGDVGATLDNLARIVTLGEAERARIEASIRRHRLDGKVVLLGQIGEEEKWALLSASDLVVLPNLHVPGDIEGFGLAVLEAGASGTFVLAADLEGLRDAVIEAGNGQRVASGFNFTGLCIQCLAPGIGHDFVPA